MNCNPKMHEIQIIHFAQLGMGRYQIFSVTGFSVFFDIIFLGIPVFDIQNTPIYTGMSRYQYNISPYPTHSHTIRKHIKREMTMAAECVQKN